MLKENNVCRLTYTHSDYFDVTRIYISQMKKFFPFKWDHFYTSNKIVQKLPTIVYNEKDKYPRRLYYSLSAIEDKFEYVFLDHDVAMSCPFRTRIVRFSAAVLEISLFSSRDCILRFVRCWCLQKQKIVRPRYRKMASSTK